AGRPRRPAAPGGPLSRRLRPHLAAARSDLGRLPALGAAGLSWPARQLDRAARPDTRLSAGIPLPPAPAARALPRAGLLRAAPAGGGPRHRPAAAGLGADPLDCRRLPAAPLPPRCA